MASRHFKHWLKAYVTHTSHSEAPQMFHFWTGVSVIAGALRRQVWRDEQVFQWTPNFYIILVAPPGIATKSTTVRHGMRLLEQVEGVHFGPQSTTWQALTESLQDAMTEVPFGAGRTLPMSCVTCAISELGTFLKPDDVGLIDALTGLWDGQLETWGHKTKHSGSATIVNPWINIIGCTTPSWLRSNFPDSLVGAGFTSRVVFVYAETKRHLIAYPSLMMEAEHYEDEQALLVEDLQRIGEIKGNYQLTPEALAWGVAWYENLWTKQSDSKMAGDRFAGYRARKQGHIHKLAMVIAASQRDELLITEDDLIYADKITLNTERDMMKVFESITSSPMGPQIQEVLSYIKAFDEITERALFQRCMKIMDEKQFNEALRSIIRAGYAARMPIIVPPTIQFLRDPEPEPTSDD